MPVNLAAGAAASLAFPLHYDGPPVHIERYRNVCLTGRSEIVSEGRILPRSYPPGERQERRSTARIERAIARASRDPNAIAGEKFLVTDWWSANYYHWLADCLPRLEALAAAERSGELLLPVEVCDLAYVGRSLEAWPAFVPVRCDPDRQPVRIETLIVPSHVAHNGFHHPVLVRRVFDRLARHFGGGQGRGRPHRRIHVTRASARMRRLANEDALLPVLERHGFDVVDLDGMDLADQIGLMAETRILSGPHGAGLTNMGFMPSGGAVLEMRHPAGPSNCFISLASAFGHGHFLLASAPPEGITHLHAADIRVTPEGLEAVLGEIESWLDTKQKAPPPDEGRRGL